MMDPKHRPALSEAYMLQFEQLTRQYVTSLQQLQDKSTTTTAIQVTQRAWDLWEDAMRPLLASVRQLNDAKLSVKQASEREAEIDLHLKGQTVDFGQQPSQPLPSQTQLVPRPPKRPRKSVEDEVPPRSESYPVKNEND